MLTSSYSILLVKGGIGFTYFYMESCMFLGQCYVHVKSIRHRAMHVLHVWASILSCMHIFKMIRKAPMTPKAFRKLRQRMKC